MIACLSCQPCSSCWRSSAILAKTGRVFGAGDDAAGTKSSNGARWNVSRMCAVLALVLVIALVLLVCELALRSDDLV
eukprot:12288103-Alexandrium_andersonii.AAC.1